jgi:hypothetical protein
MRKSVEEVVREMFYGKAVCVGLLGTIRTVFTFKDVFAVLTGCHKIKKVALVSGD